VASTPVPGPSPPPASALCAGGLTSVRGHERTLTTLRGFRREVAVRTCERLRRETRLQLQAMRQLLHALFD
jgi:hypothetical protein